MIVNNEALNTQTRRIKGKAELFYSSAITASGVTIAASNVCPKTHDVKVNKTSKNILDVKTLVDYNNATDYVANGESFTIRGKVGGGELRYDAGQLMFPYSNTATITETGYNIKAGTMYTVSFNALLLEQGQYSNKIEVLVYYSDLTAVYRTTIQLTLNENNRYSFAFTPTRDDKSGILFRVNNNYITFSNIQIEKNTEDTPFTPYLADTSTIGVKRYGKNLLKQALYGDYSFNGLTIEYLENEDCFLLNGSTTTTLSRDVFFTDYILGNVGAKYTLSHNYIDGDVKYPNGTSGKYSNIFLFSSNDNVSRSTFIELSRMENKSQQKTVTLSQQYFNSFRFYITPNVVFTDYKFRIQLEENSSVTEYESYKEPVEVVNGTVKSLSPVFTLIPNEPGLMLSAEFNGIQKLADYTYKDALQGLTIDRVGEESKFFGFGVCQKLNVKLRDRERAIQTTTASAFKPSFASGDNEYTSAAFPLFYVTETHRDENTNELSITAYDIIKIAETHTVEDLKLATPYTIKSFVEAIASYFCLTLDIQGVNDLSVFDTEYTEGANFEGSETLREVLNRIAEATQTIYFVEDMKLIFKRLGGAETALTITKADYTTLESKDNRRLSAICSATELGDNYIASIGASGTTQYVRDNPFWDLREDIAELVEKAVAAIGGLTINQFNCSWRGNYYLEIGDKIEIVTKDDNTVTSFVINDVIEYNGSLNQKTQWNYTDSESETTNNPTNLGDALKQTFAKVDKANKQIQMVVSDTEENKTSISQLQIESNKMAASVSESQEEVKGLNDEIINLTNSVNAQMTPDEIRLEITNTIQNGVDSVTTGNGFSFNTDGLTIEDINPNSNKKIKTTITNNGMIVSVEDEQVLTANDGGVYAADLHAHTFLIVGNNSRFEDYESNRTGCFWVG